MWQTLEITTPSETTTKDDHYRHRKNVYDTLCNFITPYALRGGLTTVTPSSVAEYEGINYRVKDTHSGGLSIHCKDNVTSSTYNRVYIGLTFNSISNADVFYTQTGSSDYYNAAAKHFKSSYAYIQFGDSLIFKETPTGSYGIYIINMPNKVYMGLGYSSTITHYYKLQDGTAVYKNKGTPLNASFSNELPGSVILLNAFYGTDIFENIYEHTTNGVTLTDNAINYIGGMPFLRNNNMLIALGTTQSRARALLTTEPTILRQDSTCTVATYPYYVREEKTLCPNP